MNVIKLIISITLFVFLVSPPQLCYSQSSENSEIIENTSDFSVETDKAKDKDKKDDKSKKEKDIIKLNLHFFGNLGIDILTMLIIILLFYLPGTKNRENIFSLIMFNITIFLLTFVLNDVKISMGAAFGLFAVFSMLRYRTAGISMKDMTYLFVFIALGLLGAISLDYYELGIINGIVIMFIFLLDGGILLRRELSKRIQYEIIENIKPERYNELLSDLKKRTGLDIHRVTIGRVDFLKDSASITVFYRSNKNKNALSENKTE
ncbi:MAG: DUF4956 domain-containing protein [Bacteroidales bacterium]|nr:DUF4956 domain-containing protein [Bacteroidales bacterium]HOY40078.1 DUF4956 domain-containing protein [Bacteroidales bacterium]HQP04991.1 DUF4956 domain-containing protein [Bacteroidales bacterium]